MENDGADRGMTTTEALVAAVEARRCEVSDGLDRKARGSLGQYFTPHSVADFIAQQVELPVRGGIRLLDPGAGVGSLSASLVARIIRERPQLRVHVVAFELDAALVPHLRKTLDQCGQVAAAAGVNLTHEVRDLDFVQWAADKTDGSLLAAPEKFDLCVMNPPYLKIGAGRKERLALQRRGLRVTNLYAAFLALAADLLDSGGQLCAITPRSFSNGLYFDPFRKYFFARMALDRVHVYERRGDVFADTEVLQENIVFAATRDGRRDEVLLSVGDGEARPEPRAVSHDEVIRPDDPHQFVRLPVNAEDTAVAEQIGSLEGDLAGLDIRVSTGRVVDFRSRESLRDEPGKDTVALIYPGHLHDARVVWPASKSKKPNALVDSSETRRLLLPNEIYVVVKRFTAKEEARRVVAAISSPEDVPGSSIAFENHLNVFHRSGSGLPRELAIGLTAYLNSSVVDRFVRQFNGHTQINATDLRQLPYPPTSELEELGAALVRRDGWPSQQELDLLLLHYVPALAGGDQADLREVDDDLAA